MLYKFTEKLSNYAVHSSMNSILPKTVQYQESYSDTILDRITQINDDYQMTFYSKESFIGIDCSQFTHVEDYGKNGIQFTSTKTSNRLILLFDDFDDIVTIVKRFKEFGYIE